MIHCCNVVLGLVCVSKVKLSRSRNWNRKCCTVIGHTVQEGRQEISCNHGAVTWSYQGMEQTSMRADHDLFSFASVFFFSPHSGVLPSVMSFWTVRGGKLGNQTHNHKSCCKTAIPATTIACPYWRTAFGRRELGKWFSSRPNQINALSFSELFYEDLQLSRDQSLAKVCQESRRSCCSIPRPLFHFGLSGVHKLGAALSLHHD